MFGLDPYATGAVLLLLGLVAFGLARLAADRLARRQPALRASASRPVVPLDLEPSENAVIVTQVGGHIAFMNDSARRLFALDGSEPDLDEIARRARPTDLFLELCAAEGRARLSVGEAVIEANSHRIPLASGLGQVIVMRPLTSAGGAPVQAASEVAFQKIAEISQAITGKLTLDETVQALLRGVRELIPADIVELNLWDSKSKTLTPYRAGTSRSSIYEAATAGESYRLGEGYTGWMAQHRQSLLIPDVHQRPDVGPKMERTQFPFNALLGVPLVFGGDLLGTLEAANLQPNAYDQHHRTLLEILGAHAATTLHNALLHEQQQRRADELAGLSQLTAAVNSLTDREELFGHLTQGIARLLEVDVLGFLLLDEESQHLIGQIPFVGIPDPFVDRYYQIPVQPDSAAAVIWQTQDHWLSNDVENDPEVDAVGFRALAQAASIHSTLIVPIVSGGRRLGVIQAGNKSGGGPFEPDDVRLLAILAGQTAPLIENAQLVEESRRRAERAEGLRRVTALAASAGTVDEILTYALKELVHLVRADLAAILLVDEAHSELRPHHPSLLGFQVEAEEDLLVVSTDDPAFQASVARSQRPVLSNNAPKTPELLPAYRDLVGKFDIESLIDLPLVVQNAGIGEIFLAKTHGEGFSAADLELATAFAGHIAGALDRARLSAHTDASLRRRVDQLTSLIRISRELNVTLDLERLMTLVHEEALRTTGADCGRTILFDLERDVDPPRPALNFGDADLSAGLSPLEIETLRAGASQTVGDFASVETPAPHDGVRSALLTPIAYHGRTAGLIYLHGNQPGLFDAASVQIAEGLATQAAIAIGNAQRLQEQIRRAELLRRRAEALSQIFYISSAVRSNQPLEVNLETIAYGLQAASGYSVVAISRCHQPSDEIEIIAAAGLPLETLNGVRGTRQPWSPVAALLRDEFRLSQSYVIPAALVPDTLPRWEWTPSPEDEGDHPDAWQPGDRLLVPLYGTDGEAIGLILLDAPRTGLHPDREVIETIEIFANQAALSIENTLLYAQAETTVGSLTRQLEDLRAAHEEMNRSMRDLLRQETQGARHLDTYKRRAERARALSHVVEVATAQGEDAAILRKFAQELVRELKLKAVLVTETLEEGLATTVVAGTVPEEVNIEALLGQSNPLRALSRGSEPILIEDVSGSLAWAKSPLLNGLGAKSALALPITAGGSFSEAVLLLSDEDPGPFSPEDLDLYTTAVNQLGASLEHIRLLRSVEQRLAEGNLLLEFSRQLGSLDLAVVMNTLADGLRRAMPVTEACMVALWQPDRNVLIPYGASGYVGADEILGMTFAPGESLPGAVFEAGQETRWPEIDFTRDVSLHTENLQRYTRATDGRIPTSALGVPLFAGETVLGVIVLENYTIADAFSENDVTFVRSLARQAALTVQNARLYQAAEERARQLETLAIVSATVTSSLDSRQVVQSLLVEFERVLPYDSATLWLRQGDQLRVVAAQGFADDEDRIGLTARIDDSALYKEMVQNPTPILVQDTTVDSRFPSFPEYPVRSWLGIPLTSRGEVVGLLSLDNHEKHGYQPRHIEIATTLARQAAVALENAQLYEQARRSSEELERRVAERTEALEREHERSEALLRITSELSSSLDLDRVLNRALSLVNDVIGADRGVILLVSPDSESLILRASLGGSGPLPPGGKASPFSRGEGLAGWVIESGEAVVIPDLTHDEHWIPHHDKVEEHKSALVVPLTMSEDVLGALMLFSHRRNAFDEEHLRLVSAAGSQVAAAINNAELYRLIRDQAERLGSMLRNQQIEASKSRAILESIADGVVVTDASHEIILFNSAAERILELHADTLLGRPAAEYIGVYGPAGQRWAEAVQAWSIEPPTAAGAEPFLAERLTLEDGRVVSVHLAPVVLGDEFLGTVSIFRDITREVEVDRLKSEFVATVSHELRTPMTSIKGYVEVLLMGAAGQLSEEQRRFLNIVKSNADRLGILVNDLLDVSRIEAGKVDLSFQPLDVIELLHEAEQHIQRRVQEESKPMEVTIEASETLPRVRGDPERVRQILFNLADNSFNYTPSGGQIKLSAEEGSGEVAIRVSDNGIGISPLELKRVFERFFRGEHALNLAVSGTGLGLSIVHQLVEMHSGRIWVESPGLPGKGSTFTFTLPIALPVPEPMSSQD